MLSGESRKLMFLKFFYSNCFDKTLFSFSLSTMYPCYVGKSIMFKIFNQEWKFIQECFLIQETHFHFIAAIHWTMKVEERFSCPLNISISYRKRWSWHQLPLNKGSIEFKLRIIIFASPTKNIKKTTSVPWWNRMRSNVRS